MSRIPMTVGNRLDRLTLKLSNGCWIYTGGKDRDGYGVIRMRVKGQVARPALKAHRVAYELQNGPIPDGLHIRHLCHDRACVRPDHLLTGTNADNVADMVKAGRQCKGVDKSAVMKITASRGEEHPFAKLTSEAVKEIRKRHEAGETYVCIAKNFGIAFQTVYKVVKRVSWQHVP